MCDLDFTCVNEYIYLLLLHITGDSGIILTESIGKKNALPFVI